AEREGGRRRRRVAAPRAIGPPGSSGRIAHQVECLPRHNAGDLVLAMAIRRRSREDRDQYLRAEPADDVDDVFEDRIARPEAECFFGSLGESKIVGAREELSRAVQLTSREQLFRADDAELGAKLRADQILPAFAAAQGQVCRLRAHPAREQDQELGVFVVRVRADHEDAFVAAELPQDGRQSRDAAGAGGGQLSPRDPGDAKGQHADQQQFHYWETYMVPPFITNLTRCSSVTSRVGSPATAMMSA